MAGERDDSAGGNGGTPTLHALAAAAPAAAETLSAGRSRKLRSTSDADDAAPAGRVPAVAVARTAAPESAPDVDLRAPELYLNRELTWLDFNRRVLHEARDERTPLLERVKFLAIVSTQPRRVLHEAHRRPQAAGRRRDRTA